MKVVIKRLIHAVLSFKQLNVCHMPTTAFVTLFKLAH